MAGTITSTVKSRKGLGIVRIRAAILVDASGVATATVIGSAFGRIVGIAYDPTAGAGGTMDTGADLTLTDGDSGATIWSLANAGTSPLFKRPTMAVTDNAGAAITPATTANDINRDIFVAGNIKLAVAQGGNVMTGALDVFVQEG